MERTIWPQICFKKGYALVLRRTFCCHLARMHEFARAISSGARLIGDFLPPERGALAGNSVGAAVEGVFLPQIGDAGSAKGAGPQGRTKEGRGVWVWILHEPPGGAQHRI